MSRKYQPQFVDPKGSIEDIPGVGITRAFKAGAPTAAAAGYAKGCLFQDTTNGVVYVNIGTSTSATWLRLSGTTGTVNRMVSGVTALDASNPTPVATGLTTIVSAQATLHRTTSLASGTAFVTVDFTGSDGTLNLYGWVVAGTASTGTESVSWVAFGT